jgi:hypothetical protein
MRKCILMLLMTVFTACSGDSITVQEIITSSGAVKSSIDRFSYVRENLIDGKPGTSFQFSGAKGGIGEWIEFRLAENSGISAITILNGFQLVDPEFGDLYHLNSRLKKIRVVINNARSFDYDISDTKSLIEIPVEEKNVRIVKIIVLEAYKGSRWSGDLAISEVSFSSRKKQVPVSAVAAGALIVILVLTLIFFRKKIMKIFRRAPGGEENSAGIMVPGREKKPDPVSMKKERSKKK